MAILVKRCEVHVELHDGNASESPAGEELRGKEGEHLMAHFLMWAACGARRWKHWKLKQDKASAIALSCSGV